MQSDLDQWTKKHHDILLSKKRAEQARIMSTPLDRSRVQNTLTKLVKAARHTECYKLLQKIQKTAQTNMPGRSVLFCFTANREQFIQGSERADEDFPALSSIVKASVDEEFFAPALRNIDYSFHHLGLSISDARDRSSPFRGLIAVNARTPDFTDEKLLERVNLGAPDSGIIDIRIGSVKEAIFVLPETDLRLLVRASVPDETYQEIEICVGKLWAQCYIHNDTLSFEIAAYARLHARGKKSYWVDFPAEDEKKQEG